MWMDATVAAVDRLIWSMSASRRWVWRTYHAVLMAVSDLRVGSIVHD